MNNFETNDDDTPSTSGALVDACRPGRKVKPRGTFKKGRCKPRPRTKRTCVKPKPAPTTSAAYKNFVLDYGRKHPCLDPKEQIKKAARAWCRMPEHKKEKYRMKVESCKREPNACSIL
ncbi:uncharacterized protein LOC133836436 [Drosophila sulfurigaster albostrigata]|uniref:uncharacterized protein LOC133836436 n=1 Tax=Drosophila sulfurigaster albostrigata TaxID=89887 RepID=UPI002D219CE4|nr:uncharacterized protein LOC133836436 [Drosophila sulfurigaster albostrigata]